MVKSSMDKVARSFDPGHEAGSVDRGLRWACAICSAKGPSCVCFVRHGRQSEGAADKPSRCLLRSPQARRRGEGCRSGARSRSSSDRTRREAQPAAPLLVLLDVADAEAVRQRSSRSESCRSRAAGECKSASGGDREGMVGGWLRVKMLSKGGKTFHDFSAHRDLLSRAPAGRSGGGAHPRRDHRLRRRSDDAKLRDDAVRSHR